MAKRKPISGFEIRLREWMKRHDFVTKQAADFLGVKITTLRHWLYAGIEPQESKCRECIERKLAE